MKKIQIEKHQIDFIERSIINKQSVLFFIIGTVFCIAVIFAGRALFGNQGHSNDSILIHSTNGIRGRVEEITAHIEQPEQQIEEKTSLGTFKLTAYCPCKRCSGKWGHQTASGAIAEESKTIAVDPNVIAYGTVVEIEGKRYIAQDCGANIKNNRIDVFVENHTQAEQFGIKYKEVFVFN